MNDFGFHIPGVKGLFESCEEIQRRSQLPHSDKNHIRIPAGTDVVELKHRSTGASLGKVPLSQITIKFR